MRSESSDEPKLDLAKIRWQGTGQTLADLSDLHEVRLDLEFSDPLFDESEWNDEERTARFEATVRIIRDSFLETLGEKLDRFNAAYTKHARIVSLTAGRRDRSLIIVIDLYHGKELCKA